MRWTSSNDWMRWVSRGAKGTSGCADRRAGTGCSVDGGGGDQAALCEGVERYRVRPLRDDADRQRHRLIGGERAFIAERPLPEGGHVAVAGQRSCGSCGGV